MSDYLQLGPVSFAGFEMPAQIGFGGAQRMAVHVLPGGARVIDAMGRDDADIAWSGAFSGGDASERARLLDLLRAEGGMWPLAWDSFCYLVVIAQFEASYQHGNWVPYRITCKVVRDLAQAAVELVADAVTGLLNDVAAAGLPALAGGAAVPGTADYDAALGALQSGSAMLTGGMAASGAALLAADNPAAAATAAGALAAQADARGFASRALANLDNLGA